jgi:hypothetical protein
MVAMILIKSEADIHIPKNIQDREPFSITDLPNLCEDQNSLLKEEDEQIGQLITQLSEYEQELYEKDVYIMKLEDELRQTLKASHNKGIVL